MARKFTIFALFYFVFEGKFQIQAPRGAYIRRGDFTEGFLRYDFGGLIFGGAYTWRGLFSEFYGSSFMSCKFWYVFLPVFKVKIRLQNTQPLVTDGASHYTALLCISLIFHCWHLFFHAVFHFVELILFSCPSGWQ